jgi:hypothetical protein
MINIIAVGPCSGEEMLAEDNENYTANLNHARTIVDMFSGPKPFKGKTIAGAFDIQPRTFEIASLSISQNQSISMQLPNLSFIPSFMDPYSTPLSDFQNPRGTSKQHQLVMANDRIEAVEGLIVDTRMGNASVGFRNHTLPRLDKKVSWSEVREVQIGC